MGLSRRGGPERKWTLVFYLYIHSKVCSICVTSNSLVRESSSLLGVKRRDFVSSGLKVYTDVRESMWVRLVK